MLCTYCGGDNTSAYLVCALCGRPRLITPPTGGNATATRTQATATRPMTTATVPPITPFQRPAPVVPTPAAAAGAPNFARDATRYMCAAVQLDSALSRRILAGTVEQPLRAVASSPGVDLATVVKYAVAARRRQRVTDILLLLFLPLWPVFGLGLLLGWLVVALERFRTSYRVLAPKLRRSVFDPDQAPEPASDHMRRRIADLAARDRGNVTVYPDYEPFLGFGGQEKEWSFVADVSKPAMGETIRRFTVAEVHDHVAGAIKALNLPGVTVDDRLFAAGDDLLNGSMPAVAPELLPDPLSAPRQQVGRDVIRRQWDTPQDRARPYLALRITGWSGELVMTMFVRFVQYRDEQLYVEADYRLLGPLRKDYHSVDDLREYPTFRQVGRIVAATLPITIIRQIRSPFVVVAELFRPMTLRSALRRDRREITEERTFNYGATIAPREEAMDKRYHRYFQVADKEHYLKIIERRVLDSLEQFLDAHGIDASDVRERQTMILNYGLMATGSSQIKADNMAVGLNAKATAMMSKVAGGGKG
ncbi:hypothetical protein [Actinoplanes solisilvae]|uniref:hypothetical protein n=1 Tax=Actinoplanes solisilvae TaxID=2486853 RepID=UPI000FD701D0|nr:hypothetical protein [Actinoplanes solisilvae]